MTFIPKSKKEPQFGYREETVLEERRRTGPHLISHEHSGFNGWLAQHITAAVGTMWCAYFFAVLALVSLPVAIDGGTATLVAWIAQTFLQLVLLSVIMVGQKVAASASDKQALQTYKDAEAILQIAEEIQWQTSQTLKMMNSLSAHEN